MTVREMIGVTACGTNVKITDYDGNNYGEYNKPDLEKYFSENILNARVECVIPTLFAFEIRIDLGCED